MDEQLLFLAHAPGKTWGDRYHLLERIGTGGQAVVWSAFDSETGRVVSIKANTFEEEGGESEAHRFMEQALLLAALEHPNILPLIDFGTAGSIRYQVAPYVPGGSLKGLIDNKSLSWEEVSWISGQILDALAYLHDNRIVHRDLKPGNVLMDHSLHVYLTDFGLARYLSESTQGLHTGHGTRSYAPPEQFAPGRLTFQSDLFSFGILLFEIMTGHVPWDGQRSLGLMQLSDPIRLPDPRPYNSDISEDLVDLLHHLTHPNPDHRPQSVEEVSERLRDVLPVNMSSAPKTAFANDFEALLHFGMAEDNRDGLCYEEDYSRFAYLDAVHKKQALTDDRRLFMLTGALMHGYRMDYWWGQVADPQTRYDLCVALFQKGDEAVLGRLLRLLAADTDSPTNLPQQAIERLLLVIGETPDETMQAQSLALLRRVLPAANAWKTVGIDSINDRLLAEIAAQSGAQAVEAARLIGHLRSKNAVEVVLSKVKAAQRVATLAAIQQEAGSLPQLVPIEDRMRVLGSQLTRRLAADRGRLLLALAFTFVGTTIGFSLHTFLTYRLPGFMAAIRLLNSLQRGLFMGVFAGVGIFLARTLATWFGGIGARLRFALGVLAGGSIIALGLYGYHVLFLNRSPGGALIVGGSMLIAAGFSLGAASTRRRWVQMIASLVILGPTLNLSWRLYQATGLDPLVFFEASWPSAVVWFTIALTILPIAILGNMVKLVEDGDLG